MNLPVLCKNENVHEDMLETQTCIQTELQELLIKVGWSKEEIGVIPVGGDQLSVERWWSALLTRRDELESAAHPEQLLVVLELWHAKQSFVGAKYQKLFDTASVSEPGTFYHSCVLGHQKRVSKQVKNNLNNVEDFDKIVTHAHVIAAAMTHFGISDFEQPARKFSPPSRSLLQQEKSNGSLNNFYHLLENFFNGCSVNCREGLKSK
eukprot:Pompholyxophrys_punicea_v1_NODE_331_length_2234_cov_5.731651.p1 type:complete len:207 gc:universal NODE_331_length_2234_cov_5.731651:894-274(-)